MRHLNRTFGARAALAALASTCLAFCAQAMTNHSVGPDPEQSVHVAQACQTVVRLRRGEPQYDACVASLSDSLHSVSRDRAVRELREGCLEKGLLSGSADLAECVLQLSGQTPTSSTSYFWASPREVSRREQMSCARLGFDPASRAFTSCVLNLAAALKSIDAPR